MSNIGKIVAEMSVEEKVGNLFMFGFDGTTITDELKTLIEQYHIGGIIYFSRNIKNPKQVAELSYSIQSLSSNSGHGLPVIISTDQEGGSVARLRDGVIFPGNMGLGAINSDSIVYEVGRIIGVELASVGINMDLAPVLDVNTNPLNPVIGNRSFGGDPKIVSSLGRAFIKGLHSSGILSVAKHFPGHGDTSLDSHLELPVMNKNLDELMNIHIKPFIDAIHSGVDAIMTAHVVYPALDGENPATLSKVILTDLLRGKLGFGGVIMTDCMEMKAISANHSAGDASVKALKAGVDMVLFSHTYSKQIEAYESVLKAVENGYISNEELETKVARVLQLRLNIKESVHRLNPLVVGRKEHRDFELNVARKAVTLLKNNNKTLPIRNDKSIIIIDSEITPSSLVEEKYRVPYLSDVLKEFYSKVTNVIVNGYSNDDYEKILKLLKNTTDNPVLLIIISSKEQAELLNKLIPYDNGTVAIFMKNPFLINYVNTKHIDSIIIGYSRTYCMINAIGELISGKIKPSGRLPVNLNDEYKIGAGMNDFNEV